MGDFVSFVRGWPLYVMLPGIGSILDGDIDMTDVVHPANASANAALSKATLSFMALSLELCWLHSAME